MALNPTKQDRRSDTGWGVSRTGREGPSWR